MQTPRLRTRLPRVAILTLVLTASAASMAAVGDPAAAPAPVPAGAGSAPAFDPMALPPPGTPVGTLPAPALTAVPGMSAAGPATETDRALEELDRLERDLKRELEQIGIDAEKARARTVARGRAYVRLARAGLLPVGDGFQSLVEHATRIERVRRALGRDVDSERSLAQRRIDIGKRLDALHAKRGPLEVQQRAMAQARDALLSQQDRALAFQRAFESSGPGSHTAVYGAGVGPIDPSELASGFPSLKGRLPFPLPGRAELKSARRPGSDGPGIEMRAPRGTPVRAVYGGRIAFSDEYAAYGKTVIVDHGDSYYTVSANLAELAVRAGDDVAAGTRVGSVGDMGQGPMLYFEIRFGTDTVDPAEWFGI